MKYSDFAAIRDKIGTIDIELMKLMNQRTSLMKEIYCEKDHNGSGYFDPVWEQEMMTSIHVENGGSGSLLVSSRQNNGFQSVEGIFDMFSGEKVIMAGPCAIEDVNYLESVAQFLCKNNIRVLRGGAFKPRTSPYEFQGLGREGLKILHTVGGNINS